MEFPRTSTTPPPAPELPVPEVAPAPVRGPRGVCGWAAGGEGQQETEEKTIEFPQSNCWGFTPFGPVQKLIIRTCYGVLCHFPDRIGHFEDSTTVHFMTQHGRVDDDMLIASNAHFDRYRPRTVDCPLKMHV